MKGEPGNIQREQSIPCCDLGWEAGGKPASYCMLAKNCVKGHHFNYTWLLWGLYVSQGGIKMTSTGCHASCVDSSMGTQRGTKVWTDIWTRTTCLGNTRQKKHNHILCSETFLPAEPFKIWNMSIISWLLNMFTIQWCLLMDEWCASKPIKYLVKFLFVLF